MDRPPDDHRHAARHRLEGDAAAAAILHWLEVRVFEVERAEVEARAGEPHGAANVHQAVALRRDRLESDADFVHVGRVGRDDAQTMRSGERLVEQHGFVGRVIVAVSARPLAHVSLARERRRRPRGDERLVADDGLRPDGVVHDASQHRVALTLK